MCFIPGIWHCPLGVRVENQTMCKIIMSIYSFDSGAVGLDWPGSVQVLALLTQLSPTISPASCSSCTDLPFKFVLGDILLEWVFYTVTPE